MRLAAIGLHPVKSTAIRSVAQAEVVGHGLVGDREWMIVDRDGELLSARELHRTFTVVGRTRQTDPDLFGRGSVGGTVLILDAPGMASRAVQLSGTTDSGAGTTKFGRPVAARTVAPEVDAWLAEALGVPGVRLVWSPPRTREPIAFQDGTPLTLLTDASLARLDEWLAETAQTRHEPQPAPLSYRRFRPNLYIEGAPTAFAEDGWSRVRIGTVELAGLGPVSRCVMTTLDEHTLARGKEPIRTLARHRRWDGQTWMSLGLRTITPGTLRLGDRVEVLD